jgi:hypothetical protein
MIWWNKYESLEFWIANLLNGHVVSLNKSMQF